ncbi:MAG: hypothetical protein CMP39_02540 [Rickettsiales bacterium]|nr:hypothetical protein [Rickettsiales bacterium]|tara:strand:- start:1974 stop:2441 length:468 start_codon:yes stop_codon:yes gene_type:complete
MKNTFEKIKHYFGFSEDLPFEEPEKIEEAKSPKIKPFKGSLIDSQSSRPFASSEIKIEEPRVYEDSLSIATHLRENKPVIVNLKYLDKLAGKRLIDFICGTAYAINGHMMKIGENIFLFTPAKVLIANSEEKSQLEEGMAQDEKEVFFKQASGIK